MHPHGLATRDQLLASGISSSAISRRFRRILPRIYCSGEPTVIARCHAITLWQPRAVLSHRTAAWLFGWIDAPEQHDFTVPIGITARTPDWLTVHRRTLEIGELSECQGLPVVARPRTLIDCVSVMEPEVVARIVDERLTGDVPSEEVLALLDEFPRRRGNGRARRQLESAATGFASEPERVLDRQLIVLGLRLETNYWVGRYLCDFVDVWAMVIVEVDGREFHSAPDVFSRDRRRQNDLVLEGWLVLRFSAVDVLSNPEAVGRRIVEVVRRRRKSRRPGVV
ncbi:hypothetical protein CH263_05825 [Rhodococcus sp. 06-1059B-a]|nr:DUF559 domain-containing protein [Rhodococcus sp. 06-1059B-a]OZD70935.1 hypothetical protein CH263_05825 [Rhodococcus sp. 06-1059B-a]